MQLLCLDSKFRPGKMNHIKTIKPGMLCLDSKFRPGKIGASGGLAVQ